MIGMKTQRSATVHFKVVPAKLEDIDTVLGILDEAATWIIEQKIPSVWKPGEFSRETFLDQISRGEVHIGLVDEKPAGTMTLQWADLVFWGEQLPDSGYVHKLAVRPAYAGQKIGLEMLKWAEVAAREVGKRFLRLNCLAADRKIRDYYERVGFLYKGDVVRPKAVAALYEKALQ
jgi:protein-tyrosine phosphatase